MSSLRDAEWSEWESCPKVGEEGKLQLTERKRPFVFVSPQYKYCFVFLLINHAVNVALAVLDAC